jgi:chemotaxis protein MotB
MIRRRARFRRKNHGPADHADAWLMSYADMITLLFMLFVVAASVTLSKHGTDSHGEPDHPYFLSNHSGLLSLGTPYDELYRSLEGVVASRNADQAVAVEKNSDGLWMDMSSVQLFRAGTAEIPAAQMPFVQMIARTLKNTMPPESRIDVQGYTDDTPPVAGGVADNWELSALRAARLVKLLVQEGVNPALLHASGYGDTHPIVPNSDEAGNAIAQNHLRNQRMVIRVTKP